MIDRNKFINTGLVNKYNFLSAQDKNVIKLNFDTILKHFINHKFISFKDIKLHQKLLKLRKNSPIKFGNFYDTLNLSTGLKQIFYQDKFLKLFAKILNVDIYNIYINGFMFRLDVPNDTRNSLDWHQDSSYYEMNYPDYNSGVCWASITENNSNNGSLQYIPKSHKSGFKKARSSKLKSLNSQQYKIKIPKNPIIVNLENNFGDVSCFHMNIKHRSGKNVSKKIRMTIGCRFHQINKKFNIGKEVYLFNKSRKINLFG